MKFIPKRGPAKIKTDISARDVYQIYLRDNQDLIKNKYANSTTKPINNVLFYKLWKEYIQEWMRLMVYKNETYTMPFGLGNIGIVKFRPKLSNPRTKLCMDYQKWRKTGQKIFLLNEHRDGMRYRIRWARSGARPITNKNAYYFMPSRQFKRDLVKVLKYNPEIDFSDNL